MSKRMILENSNVFIILAIIAILTAIACFNRFKKTASASCTKKPPKVPYGLLYLGHLHLLYRRPHETLTSWSMRYSKIYEICLGTQKIYVLNGARLVHDAFKKNSAYFANRPNLYMLSKSLKGLGLLSAKYNKPYIQHKLFTIGCLKNNLKSNDNSYLLNKLANYSNRLTSTKAIYLANLKDGISMVIAQDLLNFFFDIDYENHVELGKVIKLIDQNFKSTAIVSAYNYLPITRIFQTGIYRNADKVGRFLGSLLDSKLDSRIEDGVSLVDSYLKLMSTRDTFNLDELFVLLQDIFLSGTETLTNTVVWALVYAAYYPVYQEAIRREIESVIGKANDVDINADLRPNMPFVEAFLNETMRYQCSGPILVPREVTKETVVDGYVLEKGKTVYANIWSCVRDPAFWGNPSDFDPYRFIDAQGKCINNHPALLVFGIGTRKCIGKERGRSETFLIFTSLIHRFRFELVNRPETLDSITNYGITIFPSNILFQIQRIVC